MDNSIKKTLSFPHLIPGNVLGTRVHTQDDINGGIRKVVSFGNQPGEMVVVQQNEFYGGRVELVGLIKEYGFYACIDYTDGKVIGFYIYNGADVTAIGRKLLEQRYPDYTIFYEGDPTIAPLTDAEIARKAALKLQLTKPPFSVNMEELRYNNIGELEGLIRALTSGKTTQKLFEIEPTAVEPVIGEGETLEVYETAPLPVDVQKAVEKSFAKHPPARKPAARKPAPKPPTAKNFQV